MEATDELYLAELQSGPKTIAEMTSSLDGCGPVPDDVREAHL